MKAFTFGDARSGVLLVVPQPGCAVPIVHLFSLSEWRAAMRQRGINRAIATGRQSSYASLRYDRAARVPLSRSTDCIGRRTLHLHVAVLLGLALHNAAVEPRKLMRRLFDDAREADAATLDVERLLAHVTIA